MLELRRPKIATEPRMSTRVSPRFQAYALSLLLLFTMLGCRGHTREARTYLSEHYLPSAAAPSEVQVNTDGASLLEADGVQRRQLVTAPNGKAYWLRWQKTSESSGSCNSGRLIDGLHLPKTGIGYKHVGGSGYGTDETVAYLRFAAWSVAKAYPNTVPVIIGDLSDDGGGHLKPHRSHQSGRDADVGLYRTQNRPLRWFKTLPIEEIDLEKTWTFIEALLRTGAVQYIFIDTSIQTALYNEARARGFQPDELDRLFQSSKRSRRALIRHVRGHKNHLHVRFLCPRGDEDCR